MATPSSKQSSRRDEPKLKVQVWIYREKAPGALEVLLLLLRPERGGFWQPVTGGVEKGEGLSEAALREAQEETGLEYGHAPVSLDYQFRFYSPKFERECEEHAFALEAPASGKVKTDPHEHVDFRWVAASEALAELKHPSNAEALKRFLARKSGRR